MSWNQPSGRYPSGEMTWTLPYQDDDLPGVRGDTAKLMFDPNQPPGRRWSGMIEFDQCDMHDLTVEEIVALRKEYGIEEDPA